MLGRKSMFINGYGIVMCYIVETVILLKVIDFISVFMHLRILNIRRSYIMYVVKLMKTIKYLIAIFMVK